MLEKIITKIIKRNGYLDNIYTRRHLRSLIRFQKRLRKAFGLPKGVWEYSVFKKRIDLWCIDRKQSYYQREI